MGNRKKRNLAILSVIVLLVLPLYFMTIKMEEGLARKESLKGERAPAVEDRRFMNMRE